MHSQYRQSALTLLWSILQPIALVVVYAIVFSQILNVEGGGLPYLSFVVAGLAVWRFFNAGLQQATSFIDRSDTLSKVYFRREIIPLSGCLAATVDLGIGLVALFVVSWIQGVRPTVTVVALPLVLAVLVVYTVAIALVIATVTVFVRDVAHALPTISQVLFLASPVLYPESQIPEHLAFLGTANPVAVVAEATREVTLVGIWPNWGLLLVHLSIGYCTARRCGCSTCGPSRTESWTWSDMARGPVAVVEHVIKEYRLGQERTNARADPGRRGEAAESTTFRALDDVSFTLEHGQTLGLIGHNGAGKSTLLRVLAGIVEPTRGHVGVNGRFASLIELGIGFDQELTGHENVFFAGDIMGMSKAEIRRKYDEIVEFAGVQDFMDMPVKRYSTGMRARLGFAVASSIDADLLLVDEVLSVGDFEFQRRSMERIREMCDAGAALVLVSHNLWAVNSMCDRVILLDQGRTVIDAPPADAISKYLGEQAVTELDPEQGAAFEDFRVPPALTGQVRIDSVQVTPDVICSGEGVAVRATITVMKPCPGAMVVMSLFTAERAVYAERELGPSEFLSTVGTWSVEATIPAVPLSPGRFQFRVVVLPQDDRHLDQEFPAALAVASTEMKIDGDLMARPGIKLDTQWTYEREQDAPLEGADHPAAADPETSTGD